MGQFKNEVVIVGNLVAIDLVLRNDLKNKTTGEDYSAITGSYTLEVPTVDGAQNMSLRTFTMEKNKSGAVNGTFTIMKRWLDDAQANDGNLVAYANKPYRISTSIRSNIFVNQQGEVVDTVVIESGFVSDRNPGVPRAEFKQDFLITSAPFEETQRGTGDLTGRAKITGLIFDYQDVAFPITFILDNPEATTWFEGLDASNQNPVLLEIWGKVINSVSRFEHTVESAFGEPHVEVFENVVRENIITGASIEPKDISPELGETIKKGMAAHEAKLAAAKEPKQSGFNAAPKETKKSGGFSF